MAQGHKRDYLEPQMDDSAQLPPKPEVALALLQTANSVYVHLDPRGSDVFVPAWFKKQPQLVLQVGLNMAVPIPDLDVGQEALSCTLSFNRRPEFCRIPWGAIYGLVGDDGRGMIWPESIPAEVAAAADGRIKEAKPQRPHLRLAPTDRPPPGEAAEDVEAAAGEARAIAATGDDVLETAAAEVRSDSPAEQSPVDGTRPGVEARPSLVPPPSDPEDKEGRQNSSPPEEAPSVTPQKGTTGRTLPPYLRVVK